MIPILCTASVVVVARLLQADYDRPMEESGRTNRMPWDMEERNRKIAQKASSQYEMGEAA